MDAVKESYAQLTNYLDRSRQNIATIEQRISGLSDNTNKMLLVEPAVKLSELSGRQTFLEQALAAEQGTRTPQNQFGFIGWAIAGGGLAALSLGSWVYHQFQETEQYKQKIECFDKMRNQGMSTNKAATYCFGKSGILGMLGLDVKTLAMVGGAGILVYFLLKKM